MFRAVLFDLDDTLFDHRRSAAVALRQVYGAHDCVRRVPFGDFEQEHSNLLEAFHADVVAGRLGMDFARQERFRRLFERFGAQPDGDICAAAAALYRRAYVEARRATAGAAALLAHLHSRARIGVVSNNMLDEQRDKLQHCAIAQYVDALVVSEEAGVSKPDPLIFTIALERLGVGPSEAVMVGDAWNADIAGARAAGLAPVWFNPLRLPSPEPGWGVPELHALEPADAATVAILNAGRASS